jgi:hypothetical protein
MQVTRPTTVEPTNSDTTTTTKSTPTTTIAPRSTTTTTIYTITQAEWVNQFQTSFDNLEANYSAAGPLSTDNSLMALLNSLTSDSLANSDLALGQIVNDFTFFESIFPGQCTMGLPPSSANCADFVTRDLAVVQTDLSDLTS